MKNKILFITEKWCDGLPNMGLTNNYHNLFFTFKNTFPETEFAIIHLDECAHTLKTHVDNIIPKVINKFNPNIVIFSLLGKSSLNPTEYSYSFIKNKNIKMVFMWPDVGVDWGMPEIQHYLKPFADLHVCWGSEDNVSLKENILWLWCPQDENLYKPSLEKTIPVSFIGSTRYAERVKYLQYLINNKVNVLIDGGQREKKLSPKQYADLISKTKINLNFPFSPSGFDQCKGRVWEILSTKGFLLERKNNATAKMLTPNKDYIEYTDEVDLKNKIEYYLNNDQERVIIENNGYETYKSKYSSKVFWNTILNNLEK